MLDGEQPASSEPPRRRSAVLLIVGSVGLALVAMALVGSWTVTRINQAFDETQPHKAEREPAPDTASLAASWEQSGACALLRPSELDDLAALDLLGSESAGSIVAKTRQAFVSKVPTDECAYGRQSSIPGFWVTVSERFEAAEPESVEREPIPDLGDNAYAESSSIARVVVVERGSTRLSLAALVSYEVSETRARKQIDAMIDVARIAERRLPAEPAIPERAAPDTCDNVDTGVVASTLGGRVKYTRGFSADRHHLMCSYASAGERVGRAENAYVRSSIVTVQVDERPSQSDYDLARGNGQVIGEPDVDAVWFMQHAVVLGDSRIAEIEIDMAAQTSFPSKPPTGTGRLVEAVRKAFALGHPSNRGDQGGPGYAACGLLTPEQVDPLEPVGVQDEMPHQVASWVVMRSGVPTDTCGYGVVPDADPVRGIQVILSAEHYDPTAHVDSVAKPKPVPIEGLGDRAYLVTDFAGDFVVVERGTDQLVVRADLPYGEKTSTVRKLERAARAALARMPSKVSVDRMAARSPCDDIDPAAIGDALSVDVEYSRQFDFEVDRLCTWTGSDGTIAQLMLERNVAPDQVEQGDAVRIGGFDGVDTGYELVVVDADTILTINVIDPGAGVPADTGARHTSIAEAAAPILLE